MKINDSFTSFIVLVVVLISGVFLLNNGAKELSDDFSPERNLVAIPFLSSSAPPAEVKVVAEHDNDKGLTITSLDDDVKFVNYAECFPKDYLKSHPEVASTLSENSACINKRMQHDILRKKLATAEGSAGLAKLKDDMTKETLKYIDALVKDATWSNLSAKILYFGTNDTQYYEKASFSPQCLIRGGSKRYGSPEFTGMLKPKGDSSVGFVDSNDKTRNKRKSLLKTIEDFGEKRGIFGTIAGGIVDSVAGEGKYDLLKMANALLPAKGLFIEVTSDAAKMQGPITKAIPEISINFFNDPKCVEEAKKDKEAGKDSSYPQGFDISLFWYDDGISKAKRIGPLCGPDKSDVVESIKEDLSGKGFKLSEISTNFTFAAISLEEAMKKLEESDPPCFGGPEGVDPASARTSLTVTAPAQGQTIEGKTGAIFEVRWTTQNWDPGMPVNIDLIYPDGSAARVGSNQPNNGAFRFSVNAGQTASKIYRMRVSAAKFGALADGEEGLSSSFMVIPPFPAVCTYTYSAWSQCQPNNRQTRSITSTSPPGCSSTPVPSVTSRFCAYVPPATPPPPTKPLYTPTLYTPPPYRGYAPSSEGERVSDSGEPETANGEEIKLPVAPAKPSSIPSYKNPIQSDYPVLY